MDYDIIVSTLAATVRLTTPLLLACLAGLYSERSGVFDIGLEGKMLAGAFGAATVSVITGSVWLGLLAGIGVSAGKIHGIPWLSEYRNVSATTHHPHEIPDRATT